MSGAAASPLFDAHRAQLREAAQLGPVVDIACGRGRHTLAALRDGLPCLGVDRNAAHLHELRAAAREEGLGAPRLLRADLENAPHAPLHRERFGAVLVFRYLHRPLIPELVALLRPGGLLLYETFTLRQRELGYGPRRDEFLLQEGELPGLFPSLRVLSHWEGLREGERPAWLSALAAVRPG